jgi:hypothetical protein
VRNNPLRLVDPTGLTVTPVVTGEPISTIIVNAILIIGSFFLSKALFGKRKADGTPPGPIHPTAFTPLAAPQLAASFHVGSFRQAFDNLPDPRLANAVFSPLLFPPKELQTEGGGNSGCLVLHGGLAFAFKQGGFNGVRESFQRTQQIYEKLARYLKHGDPGGTQLILREYLRVGGKFIYAPDNLARPFFAQNLHPYVILGKDLWDGFPTRDWIPDHPRLLGFFHLEVMIPHELAHSIPQIPALSGAPFGPLGEPYLRTHNPAINEAFEQAEYRAMLRNLRASRSR